MTERNALARQGGGFALQPQNMDQAMQMAQMLSDSGMVPTQYKGKPSDTLVAMMMGSELGLNPIQSLQNIAVINGKPSIYGDALMALVQNHPSFGGIEEIFDENTWTATCTVWRKGGPRHTQTFSRADAEQAELWGKQGPWKTYPKRMLQMRARGFAVRDQFSDALAGLITTEEAYDHPAPEQDVTPREPARPQLEQYPQERFEEMLPKWKELVESGKKSAEDIAAMVESKSALSEGQRAKILGLEKPVDAEED